MNTEKTEQVDDSSEQKISALKQRLISAIEKECGYVLCVDDPPVWADLNLDRDSIIKIMNEIRSIREDQLMRQRDWCVSNGYSIENYPKNTD